MCGRWHRDAETQNTHRAAPTRETGYIFQLSELPWVDFAAEVRLKNAPGGDDFPIYLFRILADMVFEARSI